MMLSPASILVTVALSRAEMQKTVTQWFKLASASPMHSRNILGSNSPGFAAEAAGPCLSHAITLVHVQERESNR
jgi:hypothetical protein